MTDVWQTDHCNQWLETWVLTWFWTFYILLKCKIEIAWKKIHTVCNVWIYLSEVKRSENNTCVYIAIFKPSFHIFFSIGLYCTYRYHIVTSMILKYLQKIDIFTNIVSGVDHDFFNHGGGQMWRGVKLFDKFHLFVLHVLHNKRT